MSENLAQFVYNKKKLNPSFDLGVEIPEDKTINEPGESNQLRKNFSDYLKLTDCTNVTFSNCSFTFKS